MIVAEYPEYFKWKLTINHKFAEGDKNDIEELKQIIKLTLNFALTNDNFNKLKQYKKDAEGEHTLFLDAINKIISIIIPRSSAAIGTNRVSTSNASTYC